MSAIILWCVYHRQRPVASAHWTPQHPAAVPGRARGSARFLAVLVRAPSCRPGLQHGVDPFVGAQAPDLREVLCTAALRQPGDPGAAPRAVADGQGAHHPLVAQCLALVADAATCAHCVTTWGADNVDKRASFLPLAFAAAVLTSAHHAPLGSKFCPPLPDTPSLVACGGSALVDLLHLHRRRWRVVGAPRLVSSPTQCVPPHPLPPRTPPHQPAGLSRPPSTRPPSTSGSGRRWGATWRGWRSLRCSWPTEPRKWCAAPRRAVVLAFADPPLPRPAVAPLGALPRPQRASPRPGARPPQHSARRGLGSRGYTAAGEGGCGPAPRNCRRRRCGRARRCAEGGHELSRGA